MGSLLYHSFERHTFSIPPASCVCLPPVVPGGATLRKLYHHVLNNFASHLSHVVHLLGVLDHVSGLGLEGLRTECDTAVHLRTACCVSGSASRTSERRAQFFRITGGATEINANTDAMALKPSPHSPLAWVLGVSFGELREGVTSEFRITLSWSMIMHLSFMPICMMDGRSSMRSKEIWEM